jgi:hypothetical protein
MYYKKICNIALFGTSIFVFVIWSLFQNIDISKIGIEKVQYIVKIIFTMIYAYGFFNLSVHVLIKLLIKIPLVKKIIYGSSYIEGTWIGYYFNMNNPYLCSLHITQTIEKTNIMSKAYYLNNSIRGHWDSKSDVTIEKSNNLLSFLYEVKLSDLNASYDGMAQLFLQIKGMLKNPYKMDGFAYNLKSRIKLPMYLMKISDYQNPEIDEDELVIKAKEYYQNNNENNQFMAYFGNNCNYNNVSADSQSRYRRQSRTRIIVPDLKKMRRKV